jgi:hypothetical protein
MPRVPHGSKMRTIGAAAAIRTALSHWPASTATAPCAWSEGWKRRANRFLIRSAAMQMRPNPDRRPADCVRKGLP